MGASLQSETYWRSGSILTRAVALTGALAIMLLAAGCTGRQAPSDTASRSPAESPTLPESPFDGQEGPAPELSAPAERSIEPELGPGVHAYRVLTENDFHRVRVFYATDRAARAASDDGPAGWRFFLSALLAGGASVLLAMAGLLTSHHAARIVLLALAVGGLGITAVQTHAGAIRYQQRQRAIHFGDRIYGNQRHEVAGRPVLELGTCEVSIPPDHRVGLLESPSILKLEFHEDPQKHVVLHRVVRLPDDEYFQALKSSIDASFEGQAFIFVHGYNVGFEDAVKRTAQMAYDLRFDGAAICYSWPSHGGLAQYTQDEANVAWSVLQLEDFLLRVAERTGVKSLHLIAHSMGNRAVTQALERLALREPPPIRFGQVILAAPDVDAGEFRTRYAPAVARLARQVTLYASSNDRALLASAQVHGYTRAGLSGPHRLICPGLDTVDVSPIDTSLIGHTYYGDNPLMIRDMEAVVALSLAPEGREWLRRIREGASQAYWAFREDLPPDYFAPPEL